MILKELKEHNKEWFSRANKRFFGDKRYWVKYGKATGNRYLVRSTYAWTDMLGASKRLHYRINHILENYQIGPLVDIIFKDIWEVQEWLQKN